MSTHEKTLANAVAGLEEAAVLAKAHVGSYTRKDGTFVKEHDDGRVSVPHSQAEKKPSAGGYDHPNVVGTVSNHKSVVPGGKVGAGNGDPTHHATVSFDFAGKTYSPTGKTGNSMHDKTPVHEFEHEDSGHRVWADAKGRVHADSTSEVKKLRAEHEASANKAGADDHPGAGHVHKKGDKVRVHKPATFSHGVEGSVIGHLKGSPDFVAIKTLDGKVVSHHKNDLVPSVQPDARQAKGKK